MLAKSFILALFTLSASASLNGHHHLGHHHQSSLHLARRAGNGPPLVARRFGSPELTATAKTRRRKRSDPQRKTRLCAAVKTSSVLSATLSTPTSTSKPVEPASSTSTDSPPPSSTKTTTSTPESAPTEKPEPGPEPTGPSSGGDMFTGEATFYATGLGACGVTNSDSDYIVAVSTMMFDTYPGYTGGNPNNNPICHKLIHVEYGGKSIQVKAMDRCEGCKIYDLDFAPVPFKAMWDESLGRIPDIKWRWA